MDAAIWRERWVRRKLSRKLPRPVDDFGWRWSEPPARRPGESARLAGIDRIGAETLRVRGDGIGISSPIWRGKWNNSRGLAYSHGAGAAAAACESCGSLLLDRFFVVRSNVSVIRLANQTDVERWTMPGIYLVASIFLSGRKREHSMITRANCGGFLFCSQLDATRLRYRGLVLAIRVKAKR
jgi:hypothetical protein